MPKKRRTIRKKIHRKSHKKPYRKSHKNPRRISNIFAGDPRRSSIRRSSASYDNPFDAKVNELRRDIDDMFKYNRYGESLYMNDLNLLLMIKSEREVDEELDRGFRLKINDRKSMEDILNELITAMHSDPRIAELSHSEVAEVQDTIDNEFLNQVILLTDKGPELNPYPRAYMVKYIIDLIQHLLKRGEGTPKPDLEMYIHEWLSQFKIHIIDMAIQHMIDYNRDLRKVIEPLRVDISDREKIIRQLQRNRNNPTYEIKELNRIKTYYRNILTVKQLLENLNEKISMLSGATSQHTSKIMDKFFKRDGILFTPEEIALDICNNIANIIEYGILLVYRYNSPDLKNIYTEKDLIDTDKDKLNNILNIMSILKTVIYSTYFPFSDEDCEKIFNKFYR